MNIKKAFLLQTATGPIIVLTRYESLKEAAVVMALDRRGVKKFEAHELPLATVEAAYSAHYQHLLTDPKVNDELIVMDDDGKQVYNNITFRDFGKPVYYDNGSFK